MPIELIKLELYIFTFTDGTQLEGHSPKTSDEPARNIKSRRKKKREISNAEDNSPVHVPLVAGRPVTPFVNVSTEGPPSWKRLAFPRNWSGTSTTNRSRKDIFGLERGSRNAPSPPPLGFDLPRLNDRSRALVKPFQLPPIAKRKES